ncbi:MAG: DUF4124 domain-containing protein [Nitrospirota bacterium]
MFRSISAVVFSIAIGPAVPAFAVVFYEWTDDAGVIHLTDDVSKVPSRYRERVQEVTVPDGPPSGEEQASTAPQPPRQLSAPTEDVDFEGHDRQWWRQRLQEWRGRKATAEQNLAKARDRYNRLYFNHSSVADVRREIERYEAEILEATRMLDEVLPEGARKAGAPPGWLRE